MYLARIHFDNCPNDLPYASIVAYCNPPAQMLCSSCLEIGIRKKKDGCGLQDLFASHQTHSLKGGKQKVSINHGGKSLSPSLLYCV